MNDTSFSTRSEQDQVDFMQLIPNEDQASSKTAHQRQTREEDLSKQVRNLLLLYPITRLENEKLRLGPEHQMIFKGIDTLYLSFALFDYISECMVFESGASRLDIIDFLCFEMKKIAPQLEEEAQKIAAEIVLDQLCNSRNNHKSFTFNYFDASTGLTRSRDFRLILYKLGPTGEGHYILTKEGFAALLSMLELDSNMKLEVNEYIIQKLVDRGNFTEALRISKQNRTLTIEYRDLLNRKLFQLNRDIAQMSWENDVKPYLDKSRRHIRDRIKEEGQMLERFSSIIETATSSGNQNLHQLLNVITECQNRHRELHTQIMRFNDRFLEAQNKAFRTPKETPLAHLEDEILQQMGELPISHLIEKSSEITSVMNPPVMNKLFDPVMLLSFIDKIDTEEIEKEKCKQEEEIDVVPLKTIPDRFNDEMIREMTHFLEKEIKISGRSDLVNLMHKAEKAGYHSDQILCLVYLIYEMYGDRNASGQYHIFKNGKIDKASSPYQLISGDNLLIKNNND